MTACESGGNGLSHAEVHSCSFEFHLSLMMVVRVAIA